MHGLFIDQTVQSSTISSSHRWSSWRGSSNEKAGKELGWEPRYASWREGFRAWRQADVPHLRRPGGRIVNLSSVAAFTGRGGPYAAAKAGWSGSPIRWPSSWARWGSPPTWWRPGSSRTPSSSAAASASGAARNGWTRSPAGRPGYPDEIAAAVAYLTSPEAGYVNGEVHHVNGGWVPGR
jgi:3-oxoacyl-[acyl-carrier protein] reductase